MAWFPYQNDTASQNGIPGSLPRRGSGCRDKWASCTDGVERGLEVVDDWSGHSGFAGLSWTEER
jgi:hypothetical protein